MAEDISVRGGRNYSFPSYSTIIPDQHQDPCNNGDNCSVLSDEEPQGLSKVRRLLRHYSEDGSWPSFALPRTSNTSDFCRGGHVRSPSAYFSIRRSTLVLYSMILVVLVATTVHILEALPTKEEQEVARHYYGDSAVYSLPGSTLQMRKAQEDADRAFAPLMSNNQRSLRKKHHSYEKVQSITNSKAISESSSASLRTGCETTVLLLRHCEKGSVAEHCAYDGFERSVYLADAVFGNRWPYPSAIFVENPGRRRNPNRLNFREVETVGPLAQRSNVTVDDYYSNDNVRELTKGMLGAIQGGLWCGKVVVIVWKHSSIAHIGRLLGCGPMQGCPLDYHGKSFDQVWQLKFVFREWIHSEHKHRFGPSGQQPNWKVFGSIQDERFDPLMVSYQYGDYPRGGTQVGGRWRSDMFQFPERRSANDTAGWESKRVPIDKNPPASH